MSADGTDDSTWEADWERARSLRPCLALHAKLHAHQYRDQDWTIVEDATSGRHLRLTADAARVLEILDGNRSLEQIRDDLIASLGQEAAPSPGELLRLVTQLQLAGLLLSDAPIASSVLHQRAAQARRQRVRQRLLAPLALRIPLFDPTPLLDRGLGLVRPIFSRAGAAFWILSIATASLVAVLHAPELMEHARERALAPTNLLVLWMLFPAVKILHEFGHAFATRIWGGAVHEMGITLLVLTPVPYVDASAATAFPDKRQRMAVGAAGVIVDLWLASLALGLWVALEPSWLRDAAFDVFLIGTVSTLVFNGNPLLRFDAYYVLADALEIPNLSTRSVRYLGYLLKRYAFGLEGAPSSQMASGERRWLIAYGLTSSTYKLLIVFAIAAFLASRFFVIGVVLAGWIVLAQVALPLFRHLRFLVLDEQLRGRRRRALLVTGGASALLIGFLFFVPMPSSTLAEGIVRYPEQSVLRAAGDAFVLGLLAEDGAFVRAGDPLFETSDPDLQNRIAALEWQLQGLKTQRVRKLLSNRVEAQMIQDEIVQLRAELAELNRQVAALVIVSPADGRFVVPRSQHLPARFVQQGDTLGYVLGSGGATARVVVPEAQIGRVRSHTRAVEVRLASRPTRSLHAHIERQVPRASDRLPSKALGSSAGGSVEIDARDDAGLVARSPLFELDVMLPAQPERLAGGSIYFAGSRVHVRFEHDPEALGLRLVRRIRQLFLVQFRV